MNVVIIFYEYSSLPMMPIRFQIGCPVSMSPKDFRLIFVIAEFIVVVNGFVDNCDCFKNR